MKVGFRRLGILAASLAGAAIFAMVQASPAQAGSYDGNCEYGEVCLYYQVGFIGPMADFYDNVSNYSNWHFYNSGAWLANNTESARNRADFSCVTLYDNANYSGSNISMRHYGENADFGSLKNRFESHQFSNTFPFQC